MEQVKTSQYFLVALASLRLYFYWGTIELKDVVNSSCFLMYVLQCLIREDKCHEACATYILIIIFFPPSVCEVTMRDDF